MVSTWVDSFTLLLAIDTKKQNWVCSSAFLYKWGRVREKKRETVDYCTDSVSEQQMQQMIWIPS